jgi:hypothetical protein
MAIGSEVTRECVEGIRIEVGRRNIEDGFGVLWIFGFALSASLGLLSGCVDGDGARYWRLIDGS